MADMLPQISALGPKLQLSFLEFIYWAITHISAKQQVKTVELFPDFLLAVRKVYLEAKKNREQGKQKHHPEEGTLSLFFRNQP